jgi:hypothetical protein
VMLFILVISSFVLLSITSLMVVFSTPLGLYSRHYSLLWFYLKCFSLWCFLFYCVFFCNVTYDYYFSSYAFIHNVVCGFFFKISYFSPWCFLCCNCI